MEILARIPDLSEPSPRPRPLGRGPGMPIRAPAAVPTPPLPGQVSSAATVLPASPGPTAAVTPLEPEIPRRRRDPVRPAFPGTSILLLAVVAGLVWTAVTWREHGTVFRKSPPERWSEAFASEPAAEETDRLR